MSVKLGGHSVTRVGGVKASKAAAQKTAAALRKRGKGAIVTKITKTSTTGGLPAYLRHRHLGKYLVWERE